MPVTWLLYFYSSPVLVTLLKKQLRITNLYHEVLKEFPMGLCTHMCECVCVCVCVCVHAHTCTGPQPTLSAHRAEGHRKNNQWNIVHPSIQHWHCTYTLIPLNQSTDRQSHEHHSIVSNATWLYNRAASWKPIDCRCWNMSMCGPYTCLSYLCFSEMPAGKIIPVKQMWYGFNIW